MTTSDKAGSRPNRLANEKSPYLLQHANNPVDWYPWGDEAFAKAKAEDKPIFLSIGYSTCHWCHVMERESFEDEEVARLMNETVVAIKVDREERPDIDSVYMTVCQMLTGRGGWPLTIIMTPDRMPFYTATYIPKNERFGYPGLMELLPKVRDLWQDNRTSVLASAFQILDVLKGEGRKPSTGVLDESSPAKAADELRRRFDQVHGGFGESPKFPSPHHLLLLLRRHLRGEADALPMVEKTLTAMRLGGVFDQVGLGFHRYSTDREWRLPHFEKMLYDQAMLAMAYTEAFQATGNPFHRRVAEEIFDYVLRDMTHPDGGFFSAEDADSEGVEGKFYVWSTAQVREALGLDLGGLAIRTCNMADEGNFKEESTGRLTGMNIPYLSKDFPELLAETPELGDRMEEARKKLFEARESRVHPQKDDKILTDWNGLMIAALAKAARAFDRPDLAEAAGRAADFILKNLRDGSGRLLHRWREGEAGLPAHLDDHAFLAWGLIELYETTFATDRLKTAKDLCRDMIDRFWDDGAGGLFASEASADLLVRQKEVTDNAIPSGSSVAALVLLTLSRLTGDAALEEYVSKQVKTAAADISSMPSAATMLMAAMDFAQGPTTEVVIAGEPDAEDTRAMLKAARSGFRPRTTILLKAPGDEDIATIAPFTKDQAMQDGKATAYVCRGGQCASPVTDPARLAELLEKE